MGSRSKQIITMFLTIGHFITTTSQNVVTAPLNNIAKFISFIIQKPCLMLDQRLFSHLGILCLLPAGFIYMYIMLHIHASKQWQFAVSIYAESNV